MEELKKKKKKFSENVEFNPDSDLPIHEKFVKQKKVRNADESQEEE